MVKEEIQKVSSPLKKTYPNKRFSQLPLLSGKTSIMQGRIQNEHYLEKRALRRIAELELQRKTLEYERSKWEFQKEKNQHEVRWSHECRMMQLKEEHQQKLIEQISNQTVSLQ